MRSPSRPASWPQPRRCTTVASGTRWDHHRCRCVGYCKCRMWRTCRSHSTRPTGRTDRRHSRCTSLNNSVQSCARARRRKASRPHTTCLGMRWYTPTRGRGCPTTRRPPARTTPRPQNFPACRPDSGQHPQRLEAGLHGSCSCTDTRGRRTPGRACSTAAAPWHPWAQARRRSGCPPLTCTTSSARCRARLRRLSTPTARHRLPASAWCRPRAPQEGAGWGPTARTTESR
mmetsp:Transcript_52060/g.138667  ORF Transcript_52060/g.138667 Transcript_52060/m.138667 type:complete len:230 (-) Transcript_52060:762-1451(-)